MNKLLVMLIIKIRWAYFHVSPNYVKFYINSKEEEAYFQNIKTGAIECDFTWVENDANPTQE